jgi:hypothetical protein
VPPQAKRSFKGRKIPGPAEMFTLSWDAFGGMPAFVVGLIALSCLTSFATNFWIVTAQSPPPRAAFDLATTLLLLPVNFTVVVAIFRYQHGLRCTLKQSFVFDKRMLQALAYHLLFLLLSWLTSAGLSASKAPWLLPSGSGAGARMVLLGFWYGGSGLLVLWLSLRLLPTLNYIAASREDPFIRSFKDTKGRLYDMVMSKAFLWLAFSIPTMVMAFGFGFEYLKDKRSPVYWIISFCLTLAAIPFQAANQYASADISARLSSSPMRRIALRSRRPASNQSKKQP